MIPDLVPLLAGLTVAAILWLLGATVYARLDRWPDPQRDDYRDRVSGRPLGRVEPRP